MSNAGPIAGDRAGAVFDRLAATYDRDFTDSLIGRAQRGAVWRALLSTFKAGDRLLEINCGTGEDAFFMAHHGISVFACDASRHMIARAEQRLATKPFASRIVFCHLPTERVKELAPVRPFDGVFSNFSGLNCIEDLASVAAALAQQVSHGSKLLLCFSTRVCLIETLYYLAQGQKHKAMRRWSGRTQAVLKDGAIEVFYPTLSEIQISFSPYFRLRSTMGIGVAVPPSYLEGWAQRHPLVLRILTCIDRVAAHIPFLQTMGDHLLLTFEKVAQ